MRYKFRPEFLCDTDRFLAALDGRAENVSREVVDSTLPPCEHVAFDSALSLGELLDVAAKCADCHVIEDTLQPESDFTGERLWRAAARDAFALAANLMAEWNKKAAIVGEFVRNLPEGTPIPGDSLKEQAAWIIKTALEGKAA